MLPGLTCRHRLRWLDMPPRAPAASATCRLVGLAATMRWSFLAISFVGGLFWQFIGAGDPLRQNFIGEKLIQHWLRWFGHIQWRPPEASVNRRILMSMEKSRRGRGRSKLTWMEAVRDMMDWKVSKILALGRTAWWSAIHVSESWFNSLFLSHSCFGFLLFLLSFISSLPNLLGKKRFDVIVGWTQSKKIREQKG
jgi:hypothetical protein